MSNFGHFGAPPSPLTFHIVKNYGGGGAEGEPGRIARERRTKENKENNTGQTEIKQQRKTLEARQTILSVFFGENVAGRRPATFSQKHGLFRCSGLMTLWKVKRSPGRGPKNGQNSIWSETRTSLTLPGLVVRTALPLDRPKFRFFFPLPLPFSFYFSLSSGVFSLNFGGVLLKRRDPQMCAFGVLGLSRETGGPKPRCVHIRGSRRFKHHQNSTRRPQRKREKEQKWGRERENKARNFGPPTLRGPTFRGPTLPGLSSTFFLNVPCVTFYFVPNAVFFVPFVFFLSRMHLFILSRRPFAYFVPFAFFLSQHRPKIQVEYIDTKNQVADILTKGNFTHDEWNHLLCLFNISHFSSTVCSDTMAKRLQQDSGEERVTAKSRPMMNLIARTPSHFSSSTSVSPGRKVMAGC